MAMVGVDGEITQKAKSEMVKKNRVRNRWHLFKMLSLNPCIIKYRARYYVPKQEKESECLPGKLMTVLKGKYNKGFNNDEQEDNNNKSRVNKKYGYETLL